MKSILFLALAGLCLAACASSGPSCDYEDFQMAFGSSEGDPNFVEAYDFDKDGRISAADFGQFAVLCDIK